MAEILKTLIPGGGGDYTLMSVAESDNQQDLTIGNTFVLECYRGQIDESVGVLWNGWVTGASNFITIKAADGEGHGGVIGAGFVMNCTATSTQVLRTNQNYSQIIGIEVNSPNNNSGLYVQALEFHVSEFIAVIPSVHSGYCLEISGGSAGVSRVENSLFIGQRYGCYLINFPAVEIANCTFAEFRNGGMFKSGGAPVIKNTVAYSDDPQFAWGWTGTGWGAASTNNASSDTSAPGTNPQTGIAPSDFTDYANDDYSPALGGLLAGTGADLSTDFTTDIAGALRTVPWTIGAYVARLPATAVVHTLKASAGDYSLISTWESTEQRDLVALDETETLECYNDWPDGLADSTPRIQDWTTGENNWILVEAPVGQNHAGDINAGFLLKNNNNTGGIRPDQAYLTLRGLRVSNGGSNSTQSFSVRASETNVNTLIDSCILTKHANVNIAGCLGPGSGSSFTARNTLAYGTDVGIAFLRNCRAESCTVIDCGTGFRSVEGNPSSYEEFYVTNCVAYGCTTGFSDDGSGTMFEGAGTSNNASDVGIIPGPDPQSGITTADFSDYAGGDYSPASGGLLAGTGADLSADFTTDITGATRTVPWTIGAYIVAGGPPPVGIQEMYVKDGGIFVKYTPHVKVGGTFQEVDAYVLEGGAWVPVHEK